MTKSFLKILSRTFWETLYTKNVYICIYQRCKSIFLSLGCGNPPTPGQSTLQCARGVGACFVTCKPGHALPDGRERIVLRCENGQWQVSLVAGQISGR
jgi:hypothetical protein